MLLALCAPRLSILLLLLPARLLGTRGHGLALASHGGLPSPVQAGVEAAVYSRRVPLAQAFGGCSTDCAHPGCPDIEVVVAGMAAFQPSCTYVSRGPHPKPPAAEKAGGGRGLARWRAAQTTASPQRQAV